MEIACKLEMIEGLCEGNTEDERLAIKSELELASIAMRNIKMMTAS